MVPIWVCRVCVHIITQLYPADKGNPHVCATYLWRKAVHVFTL